VKTFGTNATFTQSSGSGVYGIKMDTAVINESLDSVITQTSSNGVGNIVSFDSTTQVLRYIQPRTNYVDTYAVGNIITIDYNYADSTSGIQTATKYDQNDFDNSTNIVIGSNSYPIDTAFSGTSVDVGAVTYYLGQEFNAGMSLPDINIKSGDIIYVDNRASVTRASQQREDIKIILEF
jgi:hypothetical protein